MRPSDKNGSGGTLSGNKKNVYVFLKIMKMMFNVSITSFLLKFAIDRALGKYLKKLLLWELKMYLYSKETSSFLTLNFKASNSRMHIKEAQFYSFIKIINKLSNWNFPMIMIESWKY